MNTRAPARPAPAEEPKRFPHSWDQAAMDSAQIKACACHNSLRFPQGRVRLHLLLKASNRPTAWTRRGRFTWNRFEACPAESTFGGGIHRLKARQIRMERSRLNTKGSRTIAASSG